jgi:hypothetical protein
MAFCNVKQNSINHIKEKGYVDSNMIVTNAMFFDENNKISDYARKKYGVESGQKVFNTVTLPSDKVKAIPNEVFLAELQKKHDIYQTQNASQGKLFQLSGSTVSSKAAPKTLALVNDFLKRIGVDVKSTKQIVVNGAKIDANAIANITQKLIEVVDGLESSALPEEAMHFAVEIMEQKDPKLFNKLLNEIGKYRIYNEVFAQYSQDKNYQTSDGKPDIRKIKKEAIGKVLAEVIINKSEGLTEKPELLAKVETWWQTILNSIKNIFSKSGFDEASMNILSKKNIGVAEDIVAEDGTIFLQKSKQDEVYDKLKEIQSTLEKRDDGYYINGKKINRRVTEEVQDWYSRRFTANELTKSEYQKAVDDLKAEKGTAGHADLEYIQSVFVDKDGYLRDEPLDDSGYVTQLDPNDRTKYQLLKNNLKARLESFPTGTRFMSEVMIYDASRKGGLAGTVDFLAITKDGKVNILDWKFMDLDIDKYTDVPWYKVAAWRQQMDLYKDIISKTYGVKNENFGQTRMIPIKAVYSKGNAKENILPKLLEIKIGDVNVKNITEDYLIPVGLESEKTGNTKVDKLLEKLNADYKTISEKKVSPEGRSDKAAQLNALFSAIRQLQMKQNLQPLLYQAKLLNKSIQNLMDRFKNTWVGTDPNSYSDDQMNAFTKELADAEKILRTYTNLDIELKQLLKEDDELRSDMKETVDEARDLEFELGEVTTEFVKDFIAKREDVEDVTKAEKVIKGLSRWFASTSTLQTGAISAFFKKATRAFTKAAMETQDEGFKLAELKEAYDVLAKSKGLSVKDYFSFIKKKGKNELIDQYTPEFYKLIKEKVADKDFEWIRDNIDVAKYNDFLNERKAIEIQRIKDKADNRIGTAEQNLADENKEIAQVNRRYDTSTPESAGWFQYDLVKKYPKAVWETKEWQTLTAKGNEAAKNFYDYIIERNNYYQSIGYVNRGEARTFLPFVRKGLVEKLVTGGDISLGEQFMRSISVDEGDIGMGNYDPRTGEMINSIPKYFTREIDGEVSEDLFKTMALYNEMAIKFKYLSSIEEQSLLLLAIERNKKAIATSVFGKTEYKDGEIQYTADNSKNAELLENMIKSTIYGQKYLQSESFDQVLGTISDFAEKINKKLGVKVLPEGFAGKQVSANKIISTINRFFQTKTLGLSLLAPLSNLFGGTAQAAINAGKYYTKSDFASSEAFLFGKMLGGISAQERINFIGALDYFLPLTENYSREFAKKLSINTLSQENIQDAMFYLMRNSDKHVQTVNFRSFIMNSIVENGQVLNAREFLRTTPEYIDMYAGTSEQRADRKVKFEDDVKQLVKDKGVLNIGKVVDGKFTLPGIDRSSDSVVKLRSQIQQVTADALGSMTEANKRMMNMTIYGDSFMMFKNWIPRLADVRFGNLKYNSASDAYEWGRMRTLFSVVSWDVIGSIGKLKNALVANDLGVEQLKELYEKKKMEYEKETGKPFNMTSSQFTDMFRNNVRNQMYDFIVLTTLFSLVLALKANAPDDEEDDRVKNSYKFMLRATDKLLDEILYFYNPTSISQLISGGIFPSMQLLTNFQKVITNFGQEMFGLALGNEDWVESARPIKYLMKTFPVTNQIQQYLPILYPDLAKDLDIRMQSTSGFAR